MTVLWSAHPLVGGKGPGKAHSLTELVQTPAHPLVGGQGVATAALLTH